MQVVQKNACCVFVQIVLFVQANCFVPEVVCSLDRLCELVRKKDVEEQA